MEISARYDKWQSDWQAQWSRDINGTRYRFVSYADWVDAEDDTWYPPQMTVYKYLGQDGHEHKWEVAHFFGEVLEDE